VLRERIGVARGSASSPRADAARRRFATDGDACVSSRRKGFIPVAPLGPLEWDDEMEDDAL
jgi:hypothetical protein